MVVVVLDGIGVGPTYEGNAVRLARTPVMDRLSAEGPAMELAAHGLSVGLPSDSDMGNSEVGHNALGAGRVIDQGAKLVNRAIASGEMFRSETWNAIVERCAKDRGTLHLLGLLSDGNVHSHIDHLLAILRASDLANIRKVAVHVLLDGRDVPETSALRYVDVLETELSTISAKPERRYVIASGGGRMTITMDRYEADWSMVERGWRTHVDGVAEHFPNARTAIETLRSRAEGIGDQDLPPFVIDGVAHGTIRDGDAVVLFNFRGDRAIEISRAFDDETFVHFDRGRRPDVLFAGMMQYDGDYQIPRRFLVAPPAIDRTMGEYLARNRVTQFACSETQKFGHVTYFWNGNRGGKFDEAQETYVEIPSDRVGFAERPWMKAAEITDATIAAIASGAHRFIRINYANGDMVGHTGKLVPTILAVEAVDLCLGRLLEAVRRANGVALVTADHGNADEMFAIDPKKGVAKRDATGVLEPKTSHTLNPVPLWLFDPLRLGAIAFARDVVAPGLANVAATALELLGFAAPTDFAPSLLRKAG